VIGRSAYVDSTSAKGCNVLLSRTRRSILGALCLVASALSLAVPRGAQAMGELVCIITPQAGVPSGLSSPRVRRASSDEASEILGILEKASQAASGIGGELEKVEVLSGIAEAQAKVGDVRAALQTAGKIPDQELRAYALERLTASVAKAGDIRGALEIAAGITDQDTKSTAYLHIVEAQLASGDVPGALQAAADIRPAVERAFAFGRIGVALSKVGDRIGAARHFQQAVQIAAGIEEESLRAHILHRLAEAQTEGGIVRGALQTALSSGGPGDKAKGLLAVGAAQARMGDGVGAKRTFRQALDAGARIRDKLGRDALFRSIAVAQAEAGDSRAASQTISRIHGKLDRACALGGVAVAQARRGDQGSSAKSFQQSVRVATTIAETSWKSQVLLDIATAQAQMGHLGDSLKTASMIPQDGWKACALQHIAGAHANAGDAGGALGIAAGITDETMKRVALLRIASVLARAGDVPRALQIAPLGDEFMKRRAIRGIAAALAMVGDTSGARRMAESQGDPLVRASTLLGVTEGLLARIGHDVPQPVGADKCWPIVR